MAFKTILSVVGLNQGPRDLDLAADLCESAGAHLSVLLVTPSPPTPTGEYAVMAATDWLKQREDDEASLKARAGEVQVFLAKRALSGDVATEYPEISMVDEMIGRRGRYADLTMIGPDLLASGTLGEKAVEGALFHSAKPILVVPAGARPTLKPKCIMIGWDARIEVMRAVQAATDLLATATEVRLVLVDPVDGDTAHGAEPGSDAASYLARHGARITVDCLPRQGKSVAAVLRQHANDCSAELMVMGAYGHSRLRERIFGGVTLSMLETPPLPILMAH